MKRLLDLPLLEVMKEINGVAFVHPVTVQKGLEYLMFMGAISEDLIAHGLDPNKILLERIVEVAIEHGGHIEKDWTVLTGQAMIDAMLHKSEQGVLFTRLTYLTARLINPSEDSQIKQQFDSTQPKKEL